ncbi:MAG: sensor histidine kinase [Thermonemataceae bacterium]
MDRFKKIPSKNSIILLASFFIAGLVGSTRFNTLQEFDMIRIDFSWWVYARLFINPFIITVILLNIYFLEAPVRILGRTVPLNLIKWKVLLSIFSFLILPAIFFWVQIQFRGERLESFDELLARRQFFFSRIIIENLTIVVTTLFIFWIYQLMRQNHRVSLANERLEKENAKAKFEALKTQVNPHFLFNSLYTLTSLIDRDTAAAKKFTYDLSEVYRYVLDRGRRDLVTLQEELNFAHAFLAMLQSRFEKAIVIHEKIDEKHLQKLIPPLSLQILLENAIKHNIFDHKQPLEIRLSAIGTNKLIVSNNLNIRPQVKKSSQVGLYNLNQRYQFLSNQELIIKKQVESFEVVLPLLDKTL